MSNQYRKCDFCGEEVQVSCTNADYDFGHIKVDSKLMCRKCKEKGEDDEI